MVPVLALSRADEPDCGPACDRPGYAIVDLGPLNEQNDPMSPLPFSPEAERTGRFGINAHGQVAFTRRIDEAHRPYIWLPRPAHGLSAGVHALVDLFPQFDFGDHASAVDISDNGFVVGQCRAGSGTGPYIIRGQGRAYIADLSGSMGWTDNARVIDGLSSGACEEGGGWSRGVAVVDDGSVPVMVMEAGRLGQCLSEDVCFSSGHLVTDLDQSTPTVTALTGTGFPSEFAFDIDRAAAGEYELAGRGDRDPRVGHCGVTITYYCEVEDVPARFSAAAGSPPSISAGALADFGDDVPEDLRGFGRGVDRGGTVVGYGTLPPDPPSSPDCDLNALLWDPADNGAYTNLHLVLGDCAGFSRAESINSAPRRRIVGWDPRRQHPLLWVEHETLDGWQGYRLQVDTHPVYPGIVDAGTCPGWTLREAYDVNDAGWITGWGIRTIGEVSQPHAFVLVPTSCPADLDQDGEVDFPDLLILLSYFDASCGTPTGPCELPWMELCPGDLDGNGVVEFPDLLFLLSYWGPCCNPGQGTPQDVQDCFTRFGWDINALLACLELVAGNQ